MHLTSVDGLRHLISRSEHPEAPPERVEGRSRGLLLRAQDASARYPNPNAIALELLLWLATETILASPVAKHGHWHLTREGTPAQPGPFILSRHRSTVAAPDCGPARAAWRICPAFVAPAL